MVEVILLFPKEKEVKADKEYIRQWIKACLAQGGTPLFRTRYPYRHYEIGKLTAICYGGVAQEMSERWVVDPALWFKIDESHNDLAVVLDEVDPELKRELLRRFEEEYKKLMKMKGRLIEIKP